MERRNALSSENADSTSRKNSFEWRRLRKRLQEIEKHEAEQQRKMNSEQVEYAMQNLSIDDLGTFTTLTRKILRSSFLPPIKRPLGTTAVSDPYAERLRGTKFMQNTRRRRHQLLEKKIIRRSFSDDSLLKTDSHNPTEDRKPKQSMNYNSLFLRKQLRECHSTDSLAIDGRSAARGWNRVRSVVARVNSKTNQSNSVRKSSWTVKNEESAFPSNGPSADKQHHRSRRQSADAEANSSQEAAGSHEEVSLCLSEVIEQKLRTRELARESRNKRVKEELKNKEDTHMSVFSKKNLEGSQKTDCLG